MILRVNSQYSAVYCVACIFYRLWFVFSHPVMSAKRPSASAASSRKKRKAITLEIKLKVIAQHEGGKPVMIIAHELGIFH